MKSKLFCALLCMIILLPGCQKPAVNTTRIVHPGQMWSHPLTSVESNISKAPQHSSNGVADPWKRAEGQSVTCENAPRPLIINTYEGSGQSTHPKVLYFEKGWNGWKYWMSFTPYPNTVDKFENPSICVSNDGKTWLIPKGLKNPVVAAPRDAGRGGHNSDPEILMNGKKMELWYRYNPARKNGRTADSKINLIYRIVSIDGVKWSRPELVLHGKYTYFSPAVLVDSGNYFIWFSDIDGKLYFTHGKDIGSLSAPVATDLRMKDFSVWHQDVIKTARGYEIVFCAYRNGEFDSNNQCLYYSVSQDGVHFKKPVKILSPSKGKSKMDNRMIYRSSIVAVENSTKLYYAAMNNSKKWNIFLTELHYN